MIDRFKREMGKINVTQVAAHRGDVALAVVKSLQVEALELYGVTIVDFQINDIRYTDQYRKALDAAAIAKAKVEQSEEERRQAEVNAQRLKIQAEGEANAVREQARGGKADGELLLATAQAKGKELVGLAEARRGGTRPSASLERCADAARICQALVRQLARQHVRGCPAPLPQPHTRRGPQSGALT
jgi:regulator of protease activity HflC (stomatin/prohibitin superfamily)